MPLTGTKRLLPPLVGSHDGPYHCSDLDKDWNILVTEKDKALEL